MTSWEYHPTVEPAAVPKSPQAREAGKFRRTGTYGLTAVAVTGPDPEGGDVPVEMTTAQALLLETRRTNRLLELLLASITGQQVEVSLSDLE